MHNDFIESNDHKSNCIERPTFITLFIYFLDCKRILKI